MGFLLCCMTNLNQCVCLFVDVLHTKWWSPWIFAKRQFLQEKNWKNKTKAKQSQYSENRFSIRTQLTIVMLINKLKRFLFWVLSCGYVLLVHHSSCDTVKKKPILICYYWHCCLQLLAHSHIKTMCVSEWGAERLE